MISEDGKQALRALHDLGVAKARWDHPGYRNLSVEGLVDHQSVEGGEKVVHRLNKRGHDIAKGMFG